MRFYMVGTPSREPADIRGRGRCSSVGGYGTQRCRNDCKHPKRTHPTHRSHIRYNSKDPASCQKMGSITRNILIAQ